MVAPSLHYVQYNKQPAQRQAAWHFIFPGETLSDYRDRVAACSDAGIRSVYARRARIATQVEAMARDYLLGGLNQTDIGLHYGMTQSGVSKRIQAFVSGLYCPFLYPPLEQSCMPGMPITDRFGEVPLVNPRYRWPRQLMKAISRCYKHMEGAISVEFATGSKREHQYRPLGFDIYGEKCA